MNDRVYETRPERRKKTALPEPPAPEPEEVIEAIEVPDEPELVNENKPHAHKKAKAHKHAN